MLVVSEGILLYHIEIQTEVQNVKQAKALSWDLHYIDVLAVNSCDRVLDEHNIPGIR